MRRKLLKHAENDRAANVLNETEAVRFRGRWCGGYFEDQSPIMLELGCGYGEYTLALGGGAGWNGLGIDLKGSRLWRGSQHALERGYDNIGFIHGSVEAMTTWFASGEVGAICIPFPDPYHKDRHERRRLTHRRFLALYAAVLDKAGHLVVKTDDLGLYAYTLGELAAVGAKIAYATEVFSEDMELWGEVGSDTCTHYEQRYREMGKSIKYIRAQFG